MTIVATAFQPENRRQPGRARPWWFDRNALAAVWHHQPIWKRRPSRRLFLDDDPRRAELFLKENGGAIWVTTADDCMKRLAENWDEVHLDHDLGGETYADFNTSNCGMEVIRWLCSEPRRHLRRTYFFVHTHNVAAGLLMILRMREKGYRAEFRPFGQDLSMVLAHNEPATPRGLYTVIHDTLINHWRALRYRSIRKPMKRR